MCICIHTRWRKGKYVSVSVCVCVLLKKVGLNEEAQGGSTAETIELVITNP